MIKISNNRIEQQNTENLANSCGDTAAERTPTSVQEESVA